MKNRLEYKLDLLQMEGEGFNRTEIIQFLADKHHVSERVGYYYFKTRGRWQPEILGLKDAKDAYHQTLNRLEYIYRHFGHIAVTAPENSNRVGALKGMLDTTLRKAEILGIWTGIQPEQVQEDPASIEVLQALSVEEEAIVMRAVNLFLDKKDQFLVKRVQEMNR